jgi:hypothetical protein
VLVNDLVIDIHNTPGALAEVAAAISDDGVNIAAATCVGSAERAELHILVPRAEAVRHALGQAERVRLTLIQSGRERRTDPAAG